MKTKTVYQCSSCSFESTRWLGKCPSCEGWNTFGEKILHGTKSARAGFRGKAREALKLPSSAFQTMERMSTGMDELDRVLGGGIVAGEMVLLGGNPGIGKSTLLLQLLEAVSKNHSALYVSGEESVEQIGMRARRLGISAENASFLTEQRLEDILATLETLKPDLTIVDSVQVLSCGAIAGTPGSVTHVRYATEQFLGWAKQNKKAVVLVGHVTKDGSLAGPKTLEHLVDAVLQLEGERTSNLRIVRGLKNRFGSTDEVGIFEMTPTGMKEVKNPSSIFLEEHSSDAIGQAISVSLEGSRPILVELQALVTQTSFGYPQRRAEGFDVNRLQLLIAVLQNSLDLPLSSFDVFLSVLGGLKLRDSACDLGIVAALISSRKKIPLKKDVAFVGEVTLTGELRPVSGQDKRIKEAGRLGFINVIAPGAKLKNLGDFLIAAGLKF